MRRAGIAKQKQEDVLQRWDQRAIRFFVCHCLPFDEGRCGKRGSSEHEEGACRHAPSCSTWLRRPTLYPAELLAPTR
jgi:hypothetical protein